MAFEELDNPKDEASYWAPCPVSGQPILGSVSIDGFRETNVNIEGSGIVVIRGLKFTNAILRQTLDDPPAKLLFNVRREGDMLVFRRFDDAEECAKFFKEQEEK